MIIRTPSPDSDARARVQIDWPRAPSDAFSRPATTHAARSRGTPRSCLYTAVAMTQDRLSADIQRRALVDDRRIRVTGAADDSIDFGPWNPGIESQVPEALQHLCTIFRPENACTGIEKARELRDLTGLPLAELATFRPRRLALHELLIRVTADFSVPEGPRTEDLGINFRRIVSRIQSLLHRRRDGPDRTCRRGRAAPPRRGHRARADGSAEDAPPRRDEPSSQSRHYESAHPAQGAAHADDRAAMHASPHRARADRRRGREMRTRPTIRCDAPRSTRWQGRECDAGPSRADLGRRRSSSPSSPPILRGTTSAAQKSAVSIEPCLDAAVAVEGYRRLPAQEHPVVINIKGPSGVGQEHRAPEAARARRRDRREPGRLRRDQPRHLAQAAHRLRHARRQLQVRRRLHRRRDLHRRPEARPLHGATRRSAARCRTC